MLTMVKSVVVSGAIVAAAGAGYVVGAAQAVPGVSSLNAAALKVLAPEDMSPARWSARRSMS